MAIGIYNGGAPFTALTLSYTGEVIIPSGVLNAIAYGLATKRVTGNTNPPTNAELEADFPGVPISFIGISDNRMVFKTAAATWFQMSAVACL